MLLIFLKPRASLISPFIVVFVDSLLALLAWQAMAFSMFSRCLSVQFSGLWSRANFAL